jgi:hypothetical protein
LVTAVKQEKGVEWRIVGKGSGGVEEMARHLTSSELFFGFLSVQFGDSLKHVFLTWLGEDARIVQKARFNGLRPLIEKVAEVRHLCERMDIVVIIPQ